MMKKTVFTILTALAVLALAFALADSSPLTELYLAEESLLFDTANVTMTGHAAFSIDGDLFKIADLTHIQDGTSSMRDWRVQSPNGFGDMTENGYTVATTGGNIYAAESFNCGNTLHYFVDESLQRTSILRHTVSSETVVGLARALFTADPALGICSYEQTDEGRVIHVLVREGETPEVMQQLLNIVLQYGISRYTTYSFCESDTIIGRGEYFYYGSPCIGLVYCLESIRLKELDLRALLDEQGHLLSMSAEASFQLKQKGQAVTNEIKLSLTQEAKAWGTSSVSEDFETYNHWRTPIQEVVNDGTWQSLPVTDDVRLKARERAAAIAVANGELTAEETESMENSVYLFTSVKYFMPFPTPMFCVRFYRGSDELYEVWLNESMDFGAGISVPVLREKAAECILRDPPIYRDGPVTGEMLSHCTGWVTFLRDREQWAYVFDNGASTYWIALFGVGPDLPPASTETGNG